MSDFEENNGMGSIAIIGMTGRFPEAKNIEEYWENLKNGVESVKFFNRNQLRAMGIDEYLLENPKFVAADAILDEMDLFDASFFDFSAREAEIMDPQHRMFLECAWEVMESAGYNSDSYQGRVAVFAGSALSGYLIRNLYSNPGLVESVGTFKIMIANSQDFLATRVSYKMNLMGPSVNVNTLCSSSIVGVHLACQNLLNYNCDLALAGGVSFQISRNEAFFYQEGGIGSADGHCRAYDHRANGTTSGSGLGIVVLKRLEDALEDGDYIYAVIRGTAVNNDGSSKNSFTAPNVDGQAECIAEAIAVSGVNPETITYIDGHGTGTDLGDPIEIAALTKAYRAYTQRKNFCGIGSAKTNIGHLVTAGGVASLIKTVLAMQHRQLPPSLNFERPNPKIDFVNSPFYVHTKLSEWKSEGGPLRAGVSSFGIGGTNTHVIIEEAPVMSPSESSRRPWQLVLLSAKTGAALERMTANLREHVGQNPAINLADLAFTLQLGRRNFNHRRVLVCRDRDDLLRKLTRLDSKEVTTRFRKPKKQPVVMIFPGEGTPIGNLKLDLYETEPVFQAEIDRCLEILQAIFGQDWRQVLNSGLPESEESKSYFNQDSINRAAVFTLDYALAKLWIDWGVNPEFFGGEGVGELVAACLAGVFSLEDALLLAVASEESLPEKAAQVSLKAPRIQFISNVSGTWIANSEASRPDYWVWQRQGVRFSEGLGEILKDPDQLILETGAGRKLTDQAKKLSPAGPEIIPVLANPESAFYSLLCGAGEFWLSGGGITWPKFYVQEKRRRIPLPTYPFERERYWIEPGKREETAKQPGVLLSKKEEITADLTEKSFQEGTLTLTINLEGSDSKEQNQKQIEKALLLKAHLDEFCANFSRNNALKVSLSPVELKEVKNQTQVKEAFGNVKLQKKPRPDFQTPYTPPRNEVEKIIVERWQEVLGFDQIGIHDDFFELGGHSLLATAVANDLSKVFSVQIPMRNLFETTTVAEIADLIETYRWATQSHEQSARSGEDQEEGSI